MLTFWFGSDLGKCFLHIAISTPSRVWPRAWSLAKGLLLKKSNRWPRKLKTLAIIASTWRGSPPSSYAPALLVRNGEGSTLR